MPQMPQRPRLRSSCDGCGIAKLKCDRGQTQCGRCLRLGQVCVYGVSRKMGKSPRGRLQVPHVSSVSRIRAEHAGGINRNRPDGNIGTGSSVGDGIVLNSGPFSSVNNVLAAWSAIDGNPNRLTTSADAPDALPSHLNEPSLPDFTSLEFGHETLPTNVKTGPISTLGSPESDSYLTPVAPVKAFQTQVDKSIYLRSALTPPAHHNGHDCSQEAHGILGSLSFLSLSMTHTTPRSAPDSTSTTTSTAHHVSFDRILRLNRESSERLRRLLKCSCARCPHHALLYASIISLVLIWYQEAAGCTQRASLRPAPAVMDPVTRHVPPYGSTSGSPPSWSNATVSTVNAGGTSKPTLTRATVLTVAPTQIEMGSFSIDDQQAQTVLRIQLLLGEIRKTDSLISLFTSRSSNGVNEFIFSSVDTMYRSLALWLRREHSRIVDIVRSRLKEISA